MGVRPERRIYSRAPLRLPLQLVRTAGRVEPVALTLVTKDISNSGVCFLAERRIEPGTPIDLEVVLVDPRLGRRRVRMITAAHIVRVEIAEVPGWYKLAAAFDDITYSRNNTVPPDFQKS